MRRFLWIGLGALLATAVAAILWPRDHRPVTTNSKQAYALYREGVELLERVETMPAREKFEAAVQADSTFAMAWIRLANTYWRMGWGAETDEATAKAKRFAPRCTELEQLQIDYWSHTFQRETEQATAALDALIKKYPDDPDVLFQHAVRLYDDGLKADDTAKFDEAYNLLQKCLAIDPTRVNSHNMLGYVEWQRGNFDAAIANLQRYAYYCPGQANPQDSLAEIYFMAGRYEEAIAHYLDALRLNPAFDNSALQVAKVLSATGQFARAHQMLDTVKQVFIEMKQENRLKLAHVGVEFEASQWDSVLAHTEQLAVLPAKPDLSMPGLPASAYTMRARAQMELRRFADAAASLDARDVYWERVQANSPKALGEGDRSEIDLNGQLLRAYLAALQGRSEQASALVATALQSTKVSPRNLRLFFYPGLAEGLLRMGDYQKAAATARETLELVPTQPTANRVLGLALANLGDLDGAQSALAIYLHVMRAADSGNPKVDEARTVYDRLRAAS